MNRIPIEEMVHALVKKHGAKNAFSIAARYRGNKYFDMIANKIVKYYPKEMELSDS